MADGILMERLSLSLSDDSISAASVSDMQDRLSSLELRVQQQEDELTVMKAALADVLRRLAQSEDMAAKKQQNTKGKRFSVIKVQNFPFEFALPVPILLREGGGWSVLTFHMAGHSSLTLFSVPVRRSSSVVTRESHFDAAFK